MASADFSRFVVTACPYGLALETSPVMDVFFPSYTRLIYSESSEQLWDFVLSCRLIHSHKPWYQVSVRRVRCLPTASFRFHLAMDTLAFGCSLPTVRAAWGLAPVRIRSCWANMQFAQRGLTPLCKFCIINYFFTRSSALRFSFTNSSKLSSMKLVSS